MKRTWTTNFTKSYKSMSFKMKSRKSQNKKQTASSTNSKLPIDLKQQKTLKTKNLNFGIRSPPVSAKAAKLTQLASSSLLAAAPAGSLTSTWMAATSDSTLKPTFKPKRRLVYRKDRSVAHLTSSMTTSSTCSRLPKRPSGRSPMSLTQRKTSSFS